MTAVAPAHAAGPVDVSVTTPGGTSTNTGSDDFTYVAAPSVTGVSPNTAPTAGGTTVTLSGTGLEGATAVTVDGQPATFTVNNDGTITVTLPAHAAGPADIVVTTPGGTSPTGAGARVTYVDAPAVTGVSPDSGGTAGNDTVVITGTGFTGATAVKFGGTNATIVMKHVDA